MRETFYFYDLETSGLNPRSDRIMQFAGQRTDADFNPIGEPTNLLVALAEDTLPSPGAIMVTGITPQQTRTDGLTEREFCEFFIKEIATPGTTILGYNSVRFDDEFMRNTLWRNFYDSYEWQWKDGRSRWDLLDVVRMTRALRPEGIEWPVTEDGHSTNRLELITKLNGIEHAHAHDALADVVALIEVTKLIKQHQPQLFDFLYRMRGKRDVQQLVNLEHPQPFVYATGRYSSQHEKTSVAYPIAPAPNGNVLVFDLRYNLDELLEQERTGRAELEKQKSAKTSSPQKSAKTSPNAAEAQPSQKSTAETPPKRAFHELEIWEKHYFPVVKKLQYNHCPAVAPLGVLEKEDGWQKLGLTKDQIERNLKSLLAHPEFIERMAGINRPDYPPSEDVESALYDGFLDDHDRMLCATVRANDAALLADYHPNFADERLPELLLHYKAKNFPSSLAEDEVPKWEAYRTKRLAKQSEGFLKEIARIQQTLARDATFGSKSPEECAFLVEELLLWYESLQPEDY